MKNALKAFSNITRVKILSCLSEKDRNVTDLIKNCGLSQSAVSQHLKKLKDLGIIDCKDCGREKLYRIKKKIAGEISKNIFKFISSK